MRASKQRWVLSTLVRPALWFCACNLLAAAPAAQGTNPTPTQVPDGTFTSGDHSQVDSNALTASSFAVSIGATATFVAGNCIHLAPGFRANAVGATVPTTFHAWTEAAPSVSAAFPSSGGGLNQQFTWTASDPTGSGDVGLMFALFNTSISGANGCYIMYNAAANMLLLADNAGTNWLGGFSPGMNFSANNSSCAIYGNMSSVSSNGNQLTLTVGVSFFTGFAGTKNHYLKVYDNEGLNSGWQQMGTWTVPGPTQYYLTTSVSPAGSGTISPASGLYNSGQLVQVSAVANPGYQFTGFSGALTGGSPQYLILNSNQSVTANFTSTTTYYPLTTTVNPSGGGTVSPSCPSGCSYAAGSQVTITATPTSGYQFNGFTGSVTSSSNPLTVTMNSAMSETANFTPSSGGTVADPTFSPAGGTYSSSQNVTISTTTPGASIRYTTDGSTPTSTTGTLYSGPVTVNASETLKAIAYETGWNNSNAVSAVYTINGAVANPTFSPVGGSYASTQNVTISTTTPGASIRYTTDGSTPTATTGTLYSGTVTVSASETLKAIAYETGWNNSNVVSALYTIGSAQTYTISGRVRIGGCPISAVNVALTGGGNPQTQTDTSGAYSFAVLTPGTYTVTPSKTGYTFTPTPAPFSLSGDLTKDFTASGPVVPPSREYIRLGGRVVAVANCGGQ